MSAPAPSMYSPAAVAVAASLGLTMGRANLEAYADALMALARADRNVIAVTSDSRGSGKLGPFAAALPDQIVELGIAEQNLVGVSAGLASAGKTVFATSPACFLSARSLEQIKNDVAVSGRPTYLRFGKAPLCDLPNAASFRPGRATTIRDGDDLAFVATGETFIHAPLAAEHLKQTRKLNAGVLGEACAGVLRQGNVATRFRIVGIPDAYAASELLA